MDSVLPNITNLPQLQEFAVAPETEEIPQEFLDRIYELYDAADRVSNVHVDAEHNYNLKSREAVYRHFGKWLLNEEEKYAEFTEPAYELEALEDLHVFPGGEDEPVGLAIDCQPRPRGEFSGQ